MTRPGEQAVGLFAAITVDEGWYFSGMSFTGMANENGIILDWEGLARSDLWWGLDELRINPMGGIATGYFGEAVIFADTPPGVYDRNPLNLNAPALVTVYAYNDAGETATASARMSFTIKGPPPPPPSAVPEPASVFLLGVGLMVPAAAAVRLRHRQAG